MKGTQRRAFHTPDFKNFVFFLRFLRFERDPAKSIPKPEFKNVVFVLKFLRFSRSENKPSAEHFTPHEYIFEKCSRRVPWQISEISEILEKHYAFEFWYVECSSLGLFSNLRNLRNLREKKHYVFEIWCLECSSLGPLQISEILEQILRF